MKKLLMCSAILISLLSGCNNRDDESPELVVKIPQQGDKNYYNDYITPNINAIDLGLSVKWGDRNIGAKSPEDFGGYYVWADPCGSMLYFPYDKFIMNSIQGTVYDIAANNLSAGWRLPTTAELYELVENCNNSITEINNISGCMITAKNGASIFLPFAGYRYGEQVGFGENQTGYFWAANYDSNNFFASYLWFGKQHNLPSYMNMSYGISIRPVFVNSSNNNDDDKITDICVKMNDPVFVDYCKKRFDFDGNGMISLNEANNVTKIDISKLNITSVKGIEYFTNLEYFTASKSNLIMADLRHNTALNSILCNNCTKLTDIYLPENLKTIEASAFAQSSIKSIKIPDSVVTIGKYAFSHCVNLESVIIGNGLQKTDDESNKYVFYHCDKLKTATLKPGLTTIGSYMFFCCGSLESITIPKSIIEWEADSFTLSGLKKVIIENGVTYIPRGAFYNCKNLKDVSIPESITTIYAGAFMNCALEHITLPSSIKKIERTAFNSDNLSLASVYCKPVVPPIADKNMFSSKNNNMVIFVPKESVNSYKTAEYWSTYASKIQGYDFQ